MYLAQIWIKEPFHCGNCIVEKSHINATTDCIQVYIWEWDEPNVMFLGLLYALSSGSCGVPYKIYL